MSRYRIKDLSKFPDCCALLVSGRCNSLNLYSCQGHKCTFKRTSKQELDSLRCVYKRLSSLDSSIQKQIAKKYYGNLMPWKETENSVK